MALSIRSQSVEKKARELARLSGLTMTDAIDEALDARIGKLAVEEVRRASRLSEIAAHCAASPDLDTRRAEEIPGFTATGA